MRAEQCGLALLVCLSLALLPGPVHLISFSVVPDVRKCLREEVHKDVLVVGEYKFSDVVGQRTDVLVRFLPDCFRK